MTGPRKWMGRDSDENEYRDSWSNEFLEGFIIRCELQVASRWWASVDFGEIRSPPCSELTVVNQVENHTFVHLVRSTWGTKRDCYFSLTTISCVTVLRQMTTIDLPNPPASSNLRRTSKGRPRPFSCPDLSRGVLQRLLFRKHDA